MFSIKNEMPLKPSGSHKQVPALKKCFSLLDLMARMNRPAGISELSGALGFHKSTVFNMVHTLVDLAVLESDTSGKFRLGPRLFSLGKAAGGASHLVTTIRPYLEEIGKKTRLSVFLGIRSGNRAIIMDKVDSPTDIKLSSEAGMSIPLLAGAGGKVLLSQLSDVELDRMISGNNLVKFTPSSCVNKKKYKRMITQARVDRFAVDDEEYIEGVRAVAVPLRLNRENLEAAIWVVGLKSQITNEAFSTLEVILKEIAEKIETRLWSEV